jgi:hypothetical protein
MASDVCETTRNLINRLGGPEAVAAGVRRYASTQEGDRRTRGLDRATVSRWASRSGHKGKAAGIPLKYWAALIYLGKEKGITVTINDLSPVVARALNTITEGAA